MNELDAIDWLRFYMDGSSVAPFSFKETESQFTVIVEMPGVSRQDIKVSLKDEKIKIKVSDNFNYLKGFRTVVENETKTKELNLVISNKIAGKIDGSKQFIAALNDGILQLYIPIKNNEFFFDIE